MSQHTQNANANRKTVMISSTARDLPDHRKEVLDACLRQGMFPKMMEYLPASDSDAIAESLKMVDQADIYLGIFAHRYGHIPKGHDLSITEMEYNRAVEHRYDLHPIVRGVIWSELDNQAKQGIYKTLNTHFESLPEIDEEQVNSLEDLTPAIELYNTLIGLGRYDDAAQLFYERLENAQLYRLGTQRQLTELLAMLFPTGLDQLPHLSSPRDQSHVLTVQALSIRDEPGSAALLLRRSIDIDQKEGDQLNAGTDLRNLSFVLCIIGHLRESESAACRALIITRQLGNQDQESVGLHWLGLTLTMRGKKVESAKALDRSLKLARQGVAYEVYDDQAWRALLFGDYVEAQELANSAMVHCQRIRFVRGMIRAARLQGEAALGLSDLSTADEYLHQALTRARTVNLVEEELPALIALAELRRRQGDLKPARELLDDVWEPAERGPFRLYHADAFNVLAQIERDAGNHSAAVEAATKAYRLAWCDGPPFAYHWGLQKAKAHLAALGAPEPSLPPFDESKFEPMPEVEIDPPDLPVPNE